MHFECHSSCSAVKHVVRYKQHAVSTVESTWNMEQKSQIKCRKIYNYCTTQSLCTLQFVYTLWPKKIDCD